MVLGTANSAQPRVYHEPRRLSDNDSSHITDELADRRAARHMEHTHGAPRRPQTRGRIERWHRALKNPILLEDD